MVNQSSMVMILKMFFAEYEKRNILYSNINLSLTCREDKLVEFDSILIGVYAVGSYVLQLRQFMFDLEF